MLVGFVGDAHGRVLHAIAAVATWQARAGRRFDLVIQVGDLGAYPDLATMDPIDPVAYPHLALDPSEADFSRLLRAEGDRAGNLKRVRAQFNCPIYFIRGNHEDYEWLQQLPGDETTGIAPADPHGFFRYVPDGRLLRFGALRIAFLGGAGDGTRGAAAGDVDRDALQSLMALGPGKFDVLVTHDAPYGISVGYRGQTLGSKLITRLVAHTQPAFHVAGHVHLNGPRAIGRTTFLCLSALRPSVRRHPDAQGLQPGCLAVLDTETARLAPVTDPWLSSFPTPFDFDAWVASEIVG